MTDIVANMTGTVIKVLVNVGDAVAEGQDVVTLESMKMHINVPANAGGTVKEVVAGEGVVVKTNDILLTLE